MLREGSDVIGFLRRKGEGGGVGREREEKDERDDVYVGREKT